MLTKMVKWIAIGDLLFAVFWPSSEAYLRLLQIVVCASSILVAISARHAEKYLWATGFVWVAIIFNPIAPLVLSRVMFLWVASVSLAMLIASLIFSRGYELVL